MLRCLKTDPPETSPSRWAHLVRDVLCDVLVLRRLRVAHQLAVAGVQDGDAELHDLLQELLLRDDVRSFCQLSNGPMVNDLPRPSERPERRYKTAAESVKASGWLALGDCVECARCLTYVPGFRWSEKQRRRPGTCKVTSTY